MEDLPAFVKTIDDVRQLGYDPNSILSKVSNFEKLQIAEKELIDRVNDFTTKKTNLERECASLQAWIDTHSLTLKKYLELEEIGFGLKEQKLLWTKIMEIGVANQMSSDQGVQKFMKDVELWDDKLGFEPQLHSLKAGIQKVEPMSHISMTAIIFYLISVLAAHLDDIQKIHEFRPLLKEAKGENVPVNELESVLIKALEIMVRALHPNDDSTVKCLISAKQALEDVI
jgi:hypothetical protein